MGSGGLWHSAISSYDNSIDRSPTLVLPVGGANSPASVEITVLSCNVGMSAKAKAEEKFYRANKTDGMMLVCTDIKAQN